MALEELQKHLSLEVGIDPYRKIETSVVARPFQGELITPLTLFAHEKMFQDSEDLFSAKTNLYNPTILADLFRVKFDRPQVLHVALQFDSAFGYGNDWAKLRLVAEGKEFNHVTFAVVSVNHGVGLHFVQEFVGNNETTDYLGISRNTNDSVWCDYTESLRFLGSVKDWKTTEINW